MVEHFRFGKLDSKVDASASGAGACEVSLNMVEQISKRKSAPPNSFLGTRSRDYWCGSVVVVVVVELGGF